jgi:carboxyl-terminal processing protease
LQAELDKQLVNNNNYKMLQESAEWKEALDKEETITLNQTKFNELMKSVKHRSKSLKVWINSITD